MARVAGFLPVCAILLSFCPLVSADAAGDFIVVNGKPVGQDTYMEQLQDVKVAATRGGQRITIPAGEYVVRQIIQNILITQLAEKEGLTPTDAQIKAKMDFAEWSSHEGMAAELKMRGITKEQWRKEIALQQCLMNLLTKGIVVSDTEAKAEYERQLKAGSSPFQSPERCNFSVIACGDKTKADSVYKRLEVGEDFAKLAREQSEDKSTAPDGGRVGWLSADMTGAPEMVLLTAFGTQVGSYSKPVFVQDKANKAWIIIKVNEKMPEQVRSFEQVKDLVREQVAVKKADRKGFEKRLAEFARAASIEINSPRYKNLPSEIKNDAGTDLGDAVAPSSPGK